MEIFLVRHTETDVPKGVCYGQSDVALKSSFPEEVEAIKEKLPIGSSKVYASPLSRCALLANALGLPVTFDDRLMELNFGDWEHQNWNDIDSEVLNRWMGDFVNVVPPGGESMGELSLRVLTWWREIHQLDQERIIVVTHAGPIRCLLAHVNNTPLISAFSDYKISFGQVIQLQ